MGDKCGQCKSKIGGPEQRIQCNVCKFFYHANCASLKATDLQYLSDTNILWVCPMCRSKSRVLRSNSSSAGSSSPPLSSLDGGLLSGGVGDADLKASLGEIMDRLGSITSDLAIIKTRQSDMLAQISACNSKLESHAVLINKNSLAVQKCSGQLGDISAAHSEITADINQLSDRMRNVEAKLTSSTVAQSSTATSDMDGDIGLMSAEILDRVRRSSNLMVAGIPEDIDIRNAVDGVLDTLLPETAGLQRRPKNVLRMRSGGNNPGLVKVCLEDSETVLFILKNSSKLKNSPYSSYSLFSDKTRRQREAEKRVRNELASMRAQGNKSARLRYVAGVPQIIQSKKKDTHDLN